jgi:hypothetical protein
MADVPIKGDYDTDTKETPSEDTGRKTPSVSQGQRFKRNELCNFLIW